MSDVLFPTSKPVWWLLTVEWAGNVIRLSTDVLSVTTQDGDVYAYDAGLDDVEVSEGVSLLSDAAGQLSVPLEFVSPVSVAALAGRGEDLSAARAELARWVEGTTWEERRVVVSGRFEDPEYGADSEPIAVSLSDSLVEDGSQVPTFTQAVLRRTHGDRWIPLNDDWKGRQYPIVIGRPGKVDTSIAASGWVTGSPACWIQFEKNDYPLDTSGAHILFGLTVLLAGHHVSARRVYMNTSTAGSSARFRVYNGFDELGQPIAYVTWYYDASNPDYTVHYNTIGTGYWYNSSASPDVAVGDGGITTSLGEVNDTFCDPSFQDDAQPSIYVGWRDDLHDGGGLEVNGVLIREAGDLIEWLLSQTTVAVDRGRMAAAKPLLSRFLLDGCITEQVSPWEFIKRELLPILPVSVCSGPEGIYVLVWRFDATESDAKLHLDADSDPAVERVDRVTVDSQDRANRLTVKYALSYRTREYNASLTLGSNQDAAENEDITAHPLCDWSRRRTGQVLEKTVETAWVYDTSTAWAVAEWLAAANALPTRTVQYRVPEVDYLHVERGDVVTLTHAELYFARQVCLVRDVTTDGLGSLVLTLHILDNPLTRLG